MTEQRIIGIVQPTYLPWLPFFERWDASDVFVLLDDVEYSKNSFFNRNSVKTGRGPCLLTIPVSYRGHSQDLIADIKVNGSIPWARKHWATISQAYAHASHWPRYKDELHALYHADRGDRLLDWVLPFIRLLGRELGMRAPLLRSSELAVSTRQNEKLIDLCHCLQGSHFIVKPGTEHYHPPELFRARSIEFTRLDYTRITYPQLHGDFAPGLSALDYLLMQGPGRPPFQPRFPERAAR